MPERALVHQPDPSPRADRNVATRLQRISTEEKSGRTAAGNLCGTIGGSLGHGNSVILIHGLLNRTATKTGDHVGPNTPTRHDGLASKEERISYLEKLAAAGKDLLAREYFQRAPAQIATPL